MKKGLGVFLLLVSFSALGAVFVKGASCQLTPGLADANVLALSWLPGFCQTYGYEKGKPECLHLSKSEFAASHLVLHGLWPNQASCGQRYGFCGVEEKTNHCDYAPLELGAPVAYLLSEMMPSYAEGSCLERHEWNKHGSCQTLTMDQYFDLAARLGQEMNQTPLGKLLTTHVGQQIELADLKRAVADAFGEDAVSKIYFACKDDALVDIYVQLSANLNSGATLNTLINEAPPQNRSDACGDTLMISNFSPASS